MQQLKNARNDTYNKNPHFYHTLMGKEMGEVSNKLAGVAGIEPAITVLETVAIPFNYTPKIRARDF